VSKVPDDVLVNNNTTVHGASCRRVIQEGEEDD
jgi:hypothetical protein